MLEQEHPVDWRKVRIGTAYRVTSKPRSLRYADHERIPFVPMNLIPQSGATEPRFIEKHPDEMTSGTYFERGDLLVARITPSFENGKQAIPVRIPQPFGVATTEVIPLQAIPDVGDVRYLFYYLLLTDVRRSIAAKMEGSTGRQRVPEGVLLGQEILLPPLPVQRAIAATLDRVQAAVETETERLRVARELKQAALAEVFTRGLRGEGTGAERESWPVVSLGSLAKIGNGSTPRRSDHRYWSGGKIPWLTSGKIHEGVIYAADQFVTELAVRECHLPRVPAGSLLVAITGQGKTLGNVAKTEIETCISQHLAYITFTESAHPDFFRYFLSSRYDDLRAAAHGMGSTKGALTCAFLKSFMVPCPNPDEQRDVAALFRGIDVRIARHEARQKLLRELFASLLRDLMTGRRRVVEVTP